MENYNPWYKSTLSLAELSALKLKVPHDVFSTQRIDEGTLLILDHLPAKAPQTVLDMGCGYGALGLPIASRFPNAQLSLVDRDLLAVYCAGQNAKSNGLSNVEAYGSLGFRDLHEQPQKYDWILCNVPARIGQPFIHHFMESARRRLNPGGETRVVVIRDLGPLLLELNEKHKWSMTQAAVGPRHTIFSVPALMDSTSHKEFNQGFIQEPQDLYLRDQVQIAGLTLMRPFDLGGDDPKRLSSGLPALIDVLPRVAPAKPFERVLCFRSGYGILPLFSRQRWPESKVVSVDRDLLATTYTRKNSKALGLDGSLLEVRECAHFPDALGTQELFDLVLGELSPSAGEAVACSELEAIDKSLARGGQAFLLCLEKNYREWIKPFVQKRGILALPLLTRESYSVLRMAKPR